MVDGRGQTNSDFGIKILCNLNIRIFLFNYLYVAGLIMKLLGCYDVYNNALKIP